MVGLRVTFGGVAPVLFIVPTIKIQGANRTAGPANLNRAGILN
jgi:hypothetical protein